MDQVHKCIIIGSGPAGYTAAVYAAGANLQPVMYTDPKPGGQLMITTEVENYPGCPDGRKGPDMMADFQKQAERFDTVIHYEVVTKVDFTGPVHKIWADGGEELQAHSIIISTGASAKWLGIEGEERLANNGVSAGAVCDGFFCKDTVTAIVGAGDSACEEALYLAKLCPEVYMPVRRDEMRASKIMRERVGKTSNINVHFNTSPVEVLGKDQVEGVRVVNNLTKEQSDIDINGFFVAIGHTPNTAISKDWLDHDDTGYLITKPDSSGTNVPGVFAGGDAQDHIYRQAVTAAGSGCMTAPDAERYLTEEGIV